MFLTRLGFGSKMVVTGRHPQIDLPPDGDLWSERRAARAPISTTRVCSGYGQDVVRHSLVATIVSAYEHRALKRKANDDEGM